MKSDDSISLSNRDINIISSLAQNTTLTAEQKIAEARKYDASEDAIQVLEYIVLPAHEVVTSKEHDAKDAADDFVDWIASVRRRSE